MSQVAVSEVAALLVEEEVHREAVVVVLPEAEEEEEEEVVAERMSSWNPIVTLAFSSQKAKNTSSSQRTSFPVNQYTERKEYPSNPAWRVPKQSTESGILSVASWLQVFWVVSMISSLHQARRFCIWEQPVELVSAMSLMLLDRYVTLKLVFILDPDPDSIGRNCLCSRVLCAFWS